MPGIASESTAAGTTLRLPHGDSRHIVDAGNPALKSWSRRTSKVSNASSQSSTHQEPASKSKGLFSNIKDMLTPIDTSRRGSAQWAVSGAQDRRQSSFYGSY